MEPQGVRWRRSAGWFGAGLILLAALVAYVALERAPFFRLDRLTVDGNQRLSQAQVLAAAGLHPGESRWRNPASEVTRRLRQEPWIKDAEVTWTLAGELRVRLMERQPLALVHYHGVFLSVDEEGYVLELVPALTGVRLPLISGVQVPPVLRGDQLKDSGLKAALSALVLLRADRRAMVAEVTTGADTYMTMYLTGSLEGTKVSLGRADRLEDKIASLLSLWSTAERDRRRLKSISVENPDLPTWQS